MKSIVFPGSAQPAPSVIYHKAKTGETDRYGKPTPCMARAGAG